MRIVKFRTPSYWRSFFCVLSGVGVMIVASGLLTRLAAPSGQILSPIHAQGVGLLTVLMALVLVPAAEMIAALLLFKESVWKTIGAVVIHSLFCIIALIVIALAVIGVVAIIRLLVG
jgi:hypothetical protein